MTARRALETPDKADRNAALELTPVSRETEMRLEKFVRLLLDRRRTVNLIAPSTIRVLWTRHVADSLQLLPLAPGNALHWVDLGTGGGFPGLVLACALAERPGAAIRLVESNARKAAFLREANRALAIPAVVHCERIEDFAAKATDRAEVITARALAPLDRLLPLIHPLMRPSTRALLMKGQDVEAELKNASRCWSIAADLVPSRTDADARILVVHALEPRR